MIYKRSAVLFLSLLIMVTLDTGCGDRQNSSHGSADLSRSQASAAFSKWVDDYLDDYYQQHPTVASVDGVHAYDEHLDSYNGSSVAEELAALSRFESGLTRIEPQRLPPSESLDYALVRNNINLRRVELDHIPMWKKNPGLYSGVISGGLMWLTLYEFAPLETRLRFVVAREREIPRVLREAKENISNPPPVFVKVALEEFEGTLDYVQTDLPKAFAGVQDPALAAEFKASTAVAAKALREYVDYLKSLLRSKPKGDFAIGADNFMDLLRYGEGLDVPLDQLLAIAKREINREQERFHEAAAQINPHADAKEVWERVKRDHPPAGTLVREAQRQLATLIQFIEQQRILTLPKAAPVIVMPTPGFFRQSFASEWNPGPFEKADLPSPYFVTDVKPSWSAKQKEEYLTAMNYASLWLTSIHEAYPGHYVQGASLRHAPSKVRKATPFAPGTYVEGWAHYTEQMMVVEQGFGGNDPKLRMAQTTEALLRLCRFYVGISMHTRGMSVDEGTKFFMHNAYMEELPARLEAERGTYDPTYLVYSVGKLEILKLREDFRRLKGSEFNLQEFHDRLLQGGNAPIWVYRRLLLGDRDDGKVLN